jgi:hypothetical protein
VDAARAVLILSGGTASVFVGTAAHLQRLAWAVEEGSGAAGPGAVWISWRAGEDEPELGNPQGLEIRQGGRLTQYVPPPKGE